MNVNFPSSEIDILGINELGQESMNDVATDGLDLPWLQDVDANQNGDSDVWHDQWEIVWRDVVILNEQNEMAGIYNLTSHDLRPEDRQNYNELRQMIVDVATANRTAAAPWQNRVEPLDVTSDMYVSPIDALTVINKINSEGSHELTPPSGSVQAYYDPSGDGFLSPRDALLVIGHLNQVGAVAAAQAASAEAPEGEADADALDGYHGVSQVSTDGQDVVGREEISEPNHASLPALLESSEVFAPATVARGAPRTVEFEFDESAQSDSELDAMKGLLVADL